MRLIFWPTAWEDYRHWIDHDAKMLAKMNALIEECRRHPFKGTGPADAVVE